MSVSLFPDPMLPPESPRPDAWLPLVRAVLAAEGRWRWRVEGRSMEPTLPAGCEIEIVPVTTPLRAGEIVVFVAHGSLVVHRLVHWRRGRWVAQGDGRRTPDAPLDPSDILGRVVGATHAGHPCWPYRYYRVVAFFWLFRYHLFRVRRLAQRYIALCSGI